MIKGKDYYGCNTVAFGKEMVWTGCFGDGESIALAFHSLLKIKIVHARSVHIQGPASRLWK